MKDIISESLIREKIKKKSLKDIGIVYYDEIDSTNTRAKLFAKNGISAPTVFIADMQSAGRGRLGRSFESDGGVGIYMTLLLPRDTSISETVKITAETAVRVRRAICRTTSLSPMIKWVNDLYIGGKKVCGILAEGIIGEGGTVQYVAIGIGINVYSRSFSSEIAEIATSLEDCGGAPTSRSALIAAIIEEMLNDYSSDELLREYRENSLILGKDVLVLQSCKSFPARAIGIDDDFKLAVECDEKILHLSSGEVSLKLKL